VLFFRNQKEVERNRGEQGTRFQGHYKGERERENQLMYTTRGRRKKIERERENPVPGIHAAVNSIEKHGSSQKPIAIATAWGIEREREREPTYISSFHASCFSCYSRPTVELSCVFIYSVVEVFHKFNYICIVL